MLSQRARRRYRQHLVETRGPVCSYCRRTFLPHKLTLDHRTPLSRGGQHEETNLVLCCPACNRSKGCCTPLEWAANILTAEGVAT